LCPGFVVEGEEALSSSGRELRRHRMLLDTSKDAELVAEMEMFSLLAVYTDPTQESTYSSV